MQPLARNLVLVGFVALVAIGLTIYSVKHKPFSQANVVAQQPQIGLSVGQQVVVSATVDVPLRLSANGNFHPKKKQYAKSGTTATITAIGPPPLPHHPQSERLFQVKLADRRTGWLPLNVLQPAGDKK